MKLEHLDNQFYFIKIATLINKKNRISHTNRMEDWLQQILDMTAVSHASGFFHVLNYDAATSTVMSATPCTCVSCLQSREAINFLAPGREGTKCSVTDTEARLPISLRQEMTVGNH